jgi:(2Fe-2S) ferredoxin
VTEVSPPSDALRDAAQLYGVGHIARHIFLCADQTQPKCAPKERTLESWNFLKRRLQELGLTASPRIVFRTRANCLRMCEQGPIAVVYPDGAWYHSRASRVGTDWELLGGVPVADRVRDEPAH